MHTSRSRVASNCPRWCVGEHESRDSSQHESGSVVVPVVCALTTMERRQASPIRPRVELTPSDVRVSLVTENRQPTPFVVLVDEGTERFLELTLASATALATAISTLAADARQNNDRPG